MSQDNSPDPKLKITVPPSDDEHQYNSEYSPASVLVVDDDEQLREGYRRLLAKAGIGTVAVPNAKLALELLRNGDLFDVIVSDIVMPGTDGIAMLREIRRYNLDVPVILVTGNPSLFTAMLTVQFGGFRYLVKPVPPPDLVRNVREAIKLHRLARLKREALLLLSYHREQLGDRASLDVYFQMALDKLWIAFQPVVGWHNRELLAYEALVRSADSRLSNPELLFDAAERLGRVPELSRKIRQLVADSIPRAPANAMIFVNLHPADLDDAELLQPEAALSQHAPRVVLELTERRSLDHCQNVGERAEQLRTIGYRVAVDNLGAGYAGLGSFSSLDPDFAKIDMALVRNIEASKRKQSLVRSLIGLCSRELGIFVVCAGVETEAERDTLESLGANLMQGYLFGRPLEGFAPVIFGGRPGV